MTSVLSIFRLVAPAFKDIDNETVTKWITLTDPLVSRRKFRHLHDQALALLTAHRMYLAGLLDTSDSLDDMGLGNLAAGKWRHISNFSEGNVSIGFNHDKGDLNTEGDAYYGLSEYGLEFLVLRDSVIATIVSAGQFGGRR